MKQDITKLSSGEQVDLSELSVEEMLKLHFDEELLFCENILSLPPFSPERKDILNRGYELAITIKEEIERKKGGKLTAQGASKASANLLIKLIKDKLSETNEPVLIYEAGVGHGYALKEIISRFHNVNSHNISIKGCDIYIQSTMQLIIDENPCLDISEGEILDSIINIPDNSIDVFYADNVIEHFIPDEAEIILSEVSKKIRPNGYFYAVIPNRYVGPGDVSSHFLPFGSKAVGTHFMEMSFNEITDLMSKFGFIHAYCIIRIPKLHLILRIKSKSLVKLKLKAEPFLAKIPTKFLRKLLFGFCGYGISVMKKGNEGTVNRDNC